VLPGGLALDGHDGAIVEDALVVDQHRVALLQLGALVVLRMPEEEEQSIVA
jgi:hypothetical protein